MHDLCEKRKYYFRTIVKGGRTMSKKAGKIAAGLGLGMAIGGMTGAIGGAVMHKGSAMKPMKKKAGKALQTMEDVLDSLQTMLK